MTEERLIEDLPLASSADGSDMLAAMRSGVTIRLSVDKIKTLIIAAITGAAPPTLDTLEELAAAWEENSDLIGLLEAALVAKADAATAATLAGPETLTNKTLTAPIIQGATAAEFLRNYKNGLTLSNNATDATNDIDIEAGSRGSWQTVPVLMTLGSAVTKRLDANWSAGSGNGMRYSGATIANTTYHLYLATTAAGVADIYADPSADTATALAHLQAEAGGAAYVNMAPIGSIIRSGGTILGFRQWRKIFRLNSEVTDTTSTTLVTDTLLALTVPNGIEVEPLLTSTLIANASSSVEVKIGSGSQTSAVQRLAISDAVSSQTSIGTIARVWTNQSRQIRYSLIANSGTVNAVSLRTSGWVDPRA